MPGQLLVKPRTLLSEPEFAARLKTHNAQEKRFLPRLRVRVLRVPESQAERTLAALRSDPGIEFAERDGLARVAFVPNDPYAVSGQEWHLAKVQAPQAWNYTTGAGAVVAVLDSGVNAAHQELAGRILPGFDFLNNNNDTSDSLGHGTAVAGVIAAAGNNGVGVAGVAYGCSVLPVRVVDSSGFAAYSDIAEGIKYAVDQGARVINISIAGDATSSTLQDAINYAWNNRVLVVAAAGNNANDVLQYPAACEHVLAVTATEPNDSLAPFSSFGTDVAIAAPGDNIWTTQSDLSNPYGSWRGTSFATPIVAGAAALLAAANPSLSGDQIAGFLEQGADDAGPTGYDTSFGYGRVNVLKALAAANPALVPSPATPAPEPVGPADTNQNTAFTTATLLVQTNGWGRVSPNLNGKLLPVGKTVRLRAVPGPGQLFAGWEGVASDSPVLELTVQSNLALVANFVPTPFPAVTGTFAGLLSNTNAISPESSGYFRLSVTSMGAFTGRLALGGQGAGFHGRFNLAGDAVVNLERGQLNPLALKLHVDLTNITDQVHGSATDGAWRSDLSGNRNVFNARMNPAAQAGLHSFLLQPANAPSGPTATGSTRIALSGTASLHGKIQNGLPFAMGSALAKNGDCPFYLSLNRGSQVVIGWLNFASGQQPAATGAVLWVSDGADGVSANLLAASAP